MFDRFDELTLHFVRQVHDRIVAGDDMSDRQKSFISEKLAVNESRLLDGANEYIQVIDIIFIDWDQYKNAVGIV